MLWRDGDGERKRSEVRVAAAFGMRMLRESGETKRWVACSPTERIKVERKRVNACVECEICDSLRLQSLRFRFRSPNETEKSKIKNCSRREKNRLTDSINRNDEQNENITRSLIDSGLVCGVHSTMMVSLVGRPDRSVFVRTYWSINGFNEQHSTMISFQSIYRSKWIVAEEFISGTEQQLDKGTGPEKRVVPAKMVAEGVQHKRKMKSYLSLSQINRSKIKNRKILTRCAHRWFIDFLSSRRRNQWTTMFEQTTMANVLLLPAIIEFRNATNHFSRCIIRWWGDSLFEVHIRGA